MPLVKWKISKQRPNEELQALASWWAGELEDPEAITNAKASMYFLSREILLQLWSEVRDRIWPRFCEDPDRFEDQLSNLRMHSILSEAEIAELSA